MSHKQILSVIWLKCLCHVLCTLCVTRSRTRLLSRRDILSREDLEIFFRDLCYRSVLYHQQTAQLQIHGYKRQKEPFILSELLHNTGQRIPPTNSCTKPTTPVWARQCFLDPLHYFPPWDCLVPSVEGSCDALFPSPQTVATSGSAVGLKVGGSSTLGVTADLWAVVQGAEGVLCCGAGTAGVAAAVTGDWDPKLQRNWKSARSMVQRELDWAVKCTSHNHQSPTGSL